MGSNENRGFVAVPEFEHKKPAEYRSMNFSLYSPRCVTWVQKHKTGSDCAPIEKCKDDFPSRLISASRVLFPQTKKLVASVHQRQEEILKYYEKKRMPVFHIKAKTVSPFISGLGADHPSETGMILDRNTGLPYIPASSVKGVLRMACAVNLYNCMSEQAQKASGGCISDADPNLVRYFGTSASSDGSAYRGKLCFLDAFPDSIAELKEDIMNPHYGTYYSDSSKQPVETESPVPIKFAVVPVGTSFSFCCYYIPFIGEKSTDRDSVQKDVTAMFDTAFSLIGFGGKTAIGYGRFQKLK